MTRALRDFQKKYPTKDVALNQLGFVRVTNLPSVPLEDLEPMDALSMDQLTPLDTEGYDLSDVYTWAFIGMLDKAIAGKLGLSVKDIQFHFPKIINRGRADRAEQELQDATDEGVTRTNQFFLDRVDPVMKEITVNEPASANLDFKKFLQMADPQAITAAIAKRHERLTYDSNNHTPE